MFLRANVLSWPTSNEVLNMILLKEKTLETVLNTKNKSAYSSRDAQVSG